MSREILLRDGDQGGILRGPSMKIYRTDLNFYLAFSLLLSSKSS